jgi:hypothetical protein
MTMGTAEQSIALKLLAPAGVALFGVLLAWAVRRSERLSATVWALGLVCSLLASDQLIRGVSIKGLPVDATRWLPHFAMLAAALVFIDYRTWNRWLAVGARLAVSLVLAWKMTSVAEPRWMWMTGITLITTVVWSMSAIPIVTGYSWLTLGIWALTLGLTGGILTLSGSASLGLVSVSFGAALGLVALVHLRWRLPAWQAVGGVVSVTLMSLVLSGQQFAELPKSSGGLILLAMLSPLLLQVRVLQLRPWIATATTIAAALLLLGGSAWLAQPAPAPEKPAETSNPYLDLYRK